MNHVDYIDAGAFPDVTPRVDGHTISPQNNPFPPKTAQRARDGHVIRSKRPWHHVRPEANWGARQEGKKIIGSKSDVG